MHPVAAERMERSENFGWREVSPLWTRHSAEHRMAAADEMNRFGILS
jgi:hypothetical protein